MNIALWVVQGLLTVIFLMAGFMKVSQTKEQMVGRAPWVEDFSLGAIRVIGTAEILGAIGLILPTATGILPWLTSLAAVGLVLTMIGAAVTHTRRGEFPNMGMNVVLLVLAGFVAYGRFALV